MTVEEILTLTKAQPFEPFTVYVAETTSYYVPHPEFIWLPPHQKAVYVVNDVGAGQRVALKHVTRLEPGKRSKSNGLVKKPKSKSKKK